METLKATQGPVLTELTGRLLYENSTSQGLGMYYKDGEQHRLVVGAAGRYQYHRMAYLYSNNELAP